MIAATTQAVRTHFPKLAIGENADGFMLVTGGVYANACRFQLPVSRRAPKSLLAESGGRGYYVPGSG
jgi:hypothetical protein